VYFAKSCVYSASRTRTLAERVTGGKRHAVQSIRKSRQRADGCDRACGLRRSWMGGHRARGSGGGGCCERGGGGCGGDDGGGGLGRPHRKSVQTSSPSAMPSRCSSILSDDLISTACACSLRCRCARDPSSRLYLRVMVDVTVSERLWPRWCL
jgi:hypothetical protein